MPSPTQSAYADTGAGTATDLTVMLPAPATAGNLLVVAANSGSTLAGPAGFTLADDAVANQALYVWYKVAAGGETALVVTPVVSPYALAAAALEYAGVDGTPLDVTAAATRITPAATWGTGTTGTTAQADELVVVAVGPAGGWTGSGSEPTGFSWTTATNRVSGATVHATDINAALAVGDYTVAATGAQTDTASWTHDGAVIGAVVATFKLTAGTTVVPGVAVETDAALSVAVTKSVALGVVAETSTALTLGASKSQTVGIAAETDTAMPIGLTGGASLRRASSSATVTARRTSSSTVTGG